MEGLTDRRNVFGTELSCRIEMSSKNRGTRIGSLRYRSRESRKLIAPLLFNLLILDEMFLYIFSRYSYCFVHWNYLIGRR